MSTPLKAQAQRIAREVLLVGDRVYHAEQAALMADFLAQDKPSKHIDDPFYWAWFNARRTISNSAWDSFAASVYALHPEATQTELARKGLVTGCLDSATHAELKKLYDAIVPSPFDGDDFTPGYYFDPNMTHHIGAERDKANECRKPSAALLRTLESWMRKEQKTIESLMGHPFRVVSVHLFSLRGDTKRGPDHRHLDGWPVSMKKMMIYMGPTSRIDGSTEFYLKDGSTALIEGPPGTWGLFENSVVNHLAVPPQRTPRPVIEISFVPALSTDTHCIVGGMNAGYPWFPLEFAADKVEGALDQYVHSTELKMYMRALNLALAAQELLRGSMIEHVAPTAGTFARSLPRRTILFLHRIRRFLRTGL